VFSFTTPRSRSTASFSSLPEPTTKAHRGKARKNENRGRFGNGPRCWWWGGSQGRSCHHRQGREHKQRHKLQTLHNISPGLGGGNDADANSIRPGANLPLIFFKVIYSRKSLSQSSRWRFPTYYPSVLPPFIIALRVYEVVGGNEPRPRHEISPPRVGRIDGKVMRQ